VITPLKLEGSAPLLLGARGSLTRDEARRSASELFESFCTANATRVLLASDNPAKLLVTIAAASRAGADLWIVAASHPAEKLESLAREFGVTLLLTDETQRSVSDEPQGAGQGRICLMTSGTTGEPKIAAHTLERLASRAVAGGSAPESRWLLTYQPTSFAGLQVILTAASTGGAIVVASHRDPLAWFDAARAHRATHVSGTPTFWRSFLMVAEPGSLPSLRQATLGGESIDQPTLDRIRHAFPQARITHIYASTEAGVVFSVNDGRAGFPASWLDDVVQGVDLRVRHGILEVRTPRSMLGYLSRHSAPLADGWLSTGDRVEVSADRVSFLGREDDVINVGGAKVHPRVVESFLLGLAGVAEARVFGYANPITGNVVAAEVVIDRGADPGALRARLLRECQTGLAAHQVPRVLRFVDSVAVAASGKKG
jgi:acyl-coenzyme A synthetase/AMP-(fatty) acid ligase